MYIGANGIIDRYCILKIDPNQPPIDDQIAFIRYLIAESNNGNQEAIQTIHETILYLGVSIANLINAVNPEILLLGGWSGLIFGKEYLDQIKVVVSKYALKQSLAKTNIRLCQLDQDAGAKGAAALVLEHFFETGGESAIIMVGGRRLGK
jgi:predicted NBD/HSP70 family sugar kinase